MAGNHSPDEKVRRTWLDWLIVAAATAIIGAFAMMARPPQIAVRGAWVAILIVAMLSMLVVSGMALWRTTRFN
jgi:hypothetical protein